MNQVLASLDLAKCYINDIIVLDSTMEEHGHHLQNVFEYLGVCMGWNYTQENVSSSNPKWSIWATWFTHEGLELKRPRWMIFQGSKIN